MSMTPMRFSESEARELVKTRHWDGGESIRAIERSLNVGKTVLSQACKRYGITVRERREQIRDMVGRPGYVAPQSGDKHWAWGKKRPDASARMKRRNPIHMAGVAAACAVSKSTTYRERQTKHELFVASLFTRCGAVFVPQHPVGAFILDFAFIADQVCVELDSKWHENPATRRKDNRRDTYLVSIGWTVIRVQQEHLRRPGPFLAAVARFVPGLVIPSGIPLVVKRTYSVFVRSLNIPHGFRL